MPRRPLYLLAALLVPTLALRAEEDEKKVETEVAVQVAKVTRTTLRRAVTAYGNIEPEPLASARLAPAQAGIIAEVNAVEGQRVEKGAVLFRLDSRAVDAAVAKAELAIEFAQKNADRQKKLIAAEGTSEKLVLEAQQALATAKTELATAKVQQSLLSGEAPLAGTLVSFTARPGEPADATKPLAEIVDLDRLVATVRVPRTEAPDLQAGQKAELRTRSGDKAIEASVVFVSPQVDSVSDTVLLRLAVPKGSGLRPGDFAAVRIIVEERAGKLAVPRASVYTDGEGKSTLSIVAGNVAKQKEVKAGLRDGDLIEVEGEGVSEGATVVTVGSYALPKETKVRVLEINPKGDAK